MNTEPNHDDLQVITVEKDVPKTKRRSSRGADPHQHPLAAQLKAMEVDDSFFIEGGDRKSTRPIVALAKKLGVPLLARDMACDEVYQTTGVRLWRIDQSEVRTRAKPVAPIVIEPAPAVAAAEDDDF